ncbi:hypothetical protein DI383_06290 [Flavobacteriaceae bacterium LYZ1037]|jgi:hypothetical protein|nr:hypothetical protein DI383_06290 [Flavobacteriaceae bacterium LYZ1037]
MKTISKIKYVALAFLIAFSVSCSTEDGAVGPAGPAGADGTDGTDGNANVQTFTFDASGFTGSNNAVSIPEITQSVLDNDAILGYLTDDGAYWVSIPSPFDSYQFDFSVQVTTSLGYFELDYGNAAGNAYTVTAGELQDLKVIIIESTSTTAGKLNSQNQVINELNQAGVNIKDYYAVCDYYGIPY